MYANVYSQSHTLFCNQFCKMLMFSSSESASVNIPTLTALALLEKSVSKYFTDSLTVGLLLMNYHILYVHYNKVHIGGA